MSLDYMQFLKRIEKAEELHRGPFLGYISPQGNIVDFSILEGLTGHDNWRNPITPFFLGLVSYAVLGTNITELERYKDSEKDYLRRLYKDYFRKMYENNYYAGFDEYVLRGPTYAGMNELSYKEFIEYLKDIAVAVRKYPPKDEWGHLKYDLLDFFEKCYSCGDFFYSFGQIIKIHSEDEIAKMYQKYFANFTDELKRDIYKEYRIMTLMSYFKDIMVRYLGYDSIERAILNDDFIFVNNINEFSGGYDFAKHPSIITSHSNPHERFFNFLLLGDWDIQVIPRMLWNEKEHRFVESPVGIFHESEKEKRLALEIESIKRNVPINERRQFFNA